MHAAKLSSLIITVTEVQKRTDPQAHKILFSRSLVQAPMKSTKFGCRLKLLRLQGFL